MYSVTIPGEPKAKGRPRIARCGPGGFVKMYSPKGTVEYENLVKLFFAQQNPGATPIKGSVCMTIEAVFSVPRSAPKKTREAMLSHEIRPTKRPDCDNIIKIFADGLKGLAYKDDSQLCYVSCSKHYGEPARCVCRIWV